MRQYYVYILSSQSRRLYVGFTSDLVTRTYQHKYHTIPGFTMRYAVDRLVYFEITQNSIGAIEREKQLKRWPRARKIRLIELHNPEWRDLAVDWYEEPPTT